MASHSYDSECPKCNKSMDSWSENRPYDIVEHQCFNCGFYTSTTEGRLDLEELNENRGDYYERFPCEKHKHDLGEFDCKECYFATVLKELPKWEE